MNEKESTEHINAEVDQRINGIKTSLKKLERKIYKKKNIFL